MKSISNVINIGGICLAAGTRLHRGLQPPRSKLQLSRRARRTGRRWMGWLGVGTAIAGLIGAFRNVSGVVAPIAALNNYLLPLFMIVLGVALARWRVTPPPHFSEPL